MTKTEYYAMVEAQVKREMVAQSPLRRLLPVWKRIQRRKDQVADLTLKEYREITGREYPCNSKRDQFGRVYVSWDNAIDNVVTQYGYETPQELYDALEQLANS
jgi:hypothetical protein